jgi:hypothetical protein
MYVDSSGFLMKTFNEYMTDGSGNDSTIPTAVEAYIWYLNSPYWKFDFEDTFNGDYRDYLIPIGLGIILCVPTGGSSIVMGLSAVQLAGIGTGVVSLSMMLYAPYSMDTSWKSITFRHANNDSLTMTFWIEYYTKDGTDIIFTVSTMRPWGLVQD